MSSSALSRLLFASDINSQNLVSPADNRFSNKNTVDSAALHIVRRLFKSVSTASDVARSCRHPRYQFRKLD